MALGWLTIFKVKSKTDKIKGGCKSYRQRFSKAQRSLLLRQEMLDLLSWYFLAKIGNNKKSRNSHF